MEGISRPYKQNKKKINKSNEFSIKGKNKTIAINKYQAKVLGFDVNPLMSAFGLDKGNDGLEILRGGRK